MAEAAKELLAQLHDNVPLTSSLSEKTSNVLAKVFSDFKTEPEFMVGSLNILDIFNGKTNGYLVDLMVKRAVISMAMKTRNMLSSSYETGSDLAKQILDVMLGSFFCDVSYARMDISNREKLTKQEFSYIQNHPAISYIMIAHEPTLSEKVKQSILLHHNPLGSMFTQTNGYPTLSALVEKLGTLQEKYKQLPERESFCASVQSQLQLLRSNVTYNDDSNIIALSSAFASLSSNVPWRQAFPAKQVVRKIINQSLFNYKAKAVREFLDGVAMSLCNNEQIIEIGSYILVAVYDEWENIIQHELAEVISVSHLQSKPKLIRLGRVKPIVGNTPHFYFQNLGLDTFEKDTRRACYDLNQDKSRRIAYLFDPEEDVEEYAFLTEV